MSGNFYVKANSIAVTQTDDLALSQEVSSPQTPHLHLLMERPD